MMDADVVTDPHLISSGRIAEWLGFEPGGHGTVLCDGDVAVGTGLTNGEHLLLRMAHSVILDADVMSAVV